MSVLEHIKNPLGGFLLTVSGWAISLEMYTVILQCLAAFLAVVTGVLTLIIAIKKIRKK